MLAIITCQVTCGEPTKSYWAFLPNPPTFQPVTWENEDIPVFTNLPQLLGGSTSLNLQSGPSSHNFSFIGLASSPPI